MICINNENKRPFIPGFRALLTGWHILMCFGGFTQVTNNFTFKQYGPQNGFESHNIRKVTEDGYGFIWIAHQEGIHRFDGTEFMKINKLTGGGIIQDKDIRDIVYDTLRKCIWALEGEARLFRIDPTTGIITKELWVPKRKSNDWNICLLLDSNNIWIGSLSGVKRFDIGEQQFVIQPAGPANADEAHTEVRHLLKDQNNRIWAFSSGSGYYVFSRQGKMLGKIAGANSSTGTCRVWGSFRYRHAILLATELGLFSFADTAYRHPEAKPARFEKIPQLRNEPVYAIEQLPGGKMIIASNTLLVGDSSFGQITKAGSQDPDIDNWFYSIRSIHVSRSGIMWLSGKGLLQVIPWPPFIEAYRYDETQLRKLGYVYSLAFFDSTLYVATDSKLITLQNGKIKQKTANAYDYLLPVGGKGLIGSNNKGSAWVAGGKGLPLPARLKEQKLNSAVCIGDSICIFGTSNYNGLVQWDLLSGEIKMISRQTEFSFTYNVVKNVFLDSKKNLWVLSNNSLLIRPDKQKAFHPVLSNLNRPDSFFLYFDICEAGGDYWLAVHQKGILQLDSNRHIKRWYTQNEGLANNGVYKLFPVGDSALYITSNQGLSVFNIRSRQFSNYYIADGLHSSAFEEACGTSADGKIYAGGPDGFSIIYPPHVQQSAIDHVIFANRIRISLPGRTIDTTNILSNHISIPEDAIQTSIYFSDLNFINPKRSSFQYQIRELNEGWIATGKQNYISLVGIPPGNYTLLLRAVGDNGKSGKVRQITLSFLPKWYQTYWFKGLILLFFIGILAALYWLRIRQLKREQQIRAVLANDLHDDLGSTLNSVKMYAHLAAYETQVPSHLENIKHGCAEAIRALRDIIWIMDTGKNSVDDLINRVLQFGEPICNAHHIKFEKKIERTALEMLVSPEEKRNLYLIMKEAINNALKYAQADRLTLEITIVNKKIAIAFSDNGCGFDTGETLQGNGIRSMRARSRQINYNFMITAAEGTRIYLEKN